MMRRLLLSGIALFLVSAVAIGCSTGVSQQEYDSLEANFEQAQQDIATANARLSDTQATLSSVRGTLSNTQAELNALEEKCPPGDFATVSQLESWVSSQQQPHSLYADQWFRAALRVQEAGLQDGYLISVDIDYYPDTDEYIITCNAVAAGSFYYWNPETATVYPWGFAR